MNDITSKNTKEYKEYKEKFGLGDCNNQVSSYLEKNLKHRNYKELPVDAYKTEILEQIKKSDEVIISAETGAGKSTRVPQFLAEAGYNVIITQPRRLAATSLAQHVADEMGVKLGKEVGYHIGGSNGEFKKISKDTKIKYCTDGLHLVQQLVADNQNDYKNTVLIIDEIHEWNQNIEILLAWIKKEKELGKKIKVILMSATLEQERLEKFINTSSKRQETIEIPGRLYPVEYETSSEYNLIGKIIELQNAQRNILVFQPGKKEIEETIDTLDAKLGNSAIILPLHGELTVEEQARVFKNYNKPVIIVSTNIAQTSVTIPYIDAVVDSAIEKRIELDNGVETLAIGHISQADMTQRAGRAGRCKPGIYVYCNDTPPHSLDVFPKAEIERTRLDLNYLRILAKTGYGMEDLDFFHQPPLENIIHAKKTLTTLGAISKDGQITKLGKQLSQLPIDVNNGIMVLKALEEGVLDEILKIVSIREQGGIVFHKSKDDVPRDCINRKSDLLTQLSLFEKVRDIKTKKDEFGKTIKKEQQLKELGINHKSYFRAVESYLHLKNIFAHNNKRNRKTLSDGEKQDIILKCIVSGMVDNVWINDNYNGYSKEKNGESRNLSRSSFINESKIIIAEPMNIQFTDRRGSIGEIKILGNASNVSAELLKELAPDQIDTDKHMDKRDDEKQAVVHQMDTLFNGLVIKKEEINSDANDETIKIFCSALASGYKVKFENKDLQEICEHNNRILKEMENFYVRFAGSFPRFQSGELSDYLFEILHNRGIVSTLDLQNAIENDKAGLCEVLKLNEAHLLIRDYEKKLKQYPQEIIYNNKTYTVTYKRAWSQDEIIFINISEEDLEQINDQSFSDYFEGKKYNYLLDRDDNRIEIYNLKKYLEEQKQKKLEEKRKDFDASFNAKLEEITFDKWDGERETQSKVFDIESDSKAYLGLVKKYADNAFECKRFRSLEQAENSTETVKHAFEAYKADLAKKTEYEQKIQDYRNNYDKIIDKLNNIAYRDDYDEAYTINRIRQNIENKIEDHNYSGYVLEEISKSLENLDKQIDDLSNKIEFEEKADQLIEEYDIPEEIVEIFDSKSLLEFVENIKSLPIDEIDYHILYNCGRSRVHDHLISLSGNDDFFCGRDPNDVKYFIANFLTSHGKDKEEGNTGTGDTENGEISALDIERLKNKRGPSNIIIK